MATKKVKYFAYAEAVFASNLTANAKLVLLAIADHYNWSKGLSAYPSNTTLSNKTSLHINTVRNLIAKLKDAGWLEQTGWMVINNKSMKSWKPTIPLQNSASPLQNKDFTPTNWDVENVDKQIINIEIYKQRRLNKEVNKEKKFWQVFTDLSKRSKGIK